MSMFNITHVSLIKASALFLGMMLFILSHAEIAPVVVQGVVPDAETKQRIIRQLQEIYGDLRVIDEIEVNAKVRTPPNWNKVVDNALNPEIKNITKGRMEIHGPLIGVYGKIQEPNTAEDIANKLFGNLTDIYQLTNQLEVEAAEQKVIDDTLADRIIEFAPASAELTPLSLGILDEMAQALQNISTNRVEIIGHTDSIGDPAQNLKLSQRRANAVKQYLIGRNIDPDRMTTHGEGANLPIASNSTEQGRTRNRRIEFKLIR